MSEQNKEQTTEQMANWEVLQKVMARTKRCVTEIEGEQLAFVVGKLSPKQASAATEKNPYAMLAAGMVEPKLSEGQIEQLPIEFVNAVSKAVAEFNGFDLKAIEKN